jgi:transposase InsO family protein
MNSTKEIDWIIDSGATLHMCNSAEYLMNYTASYGHNVIISDGSKIPIHGYGTLIVHLKDNNNNVKKVKLNNVAVVPKLSVNLISVRALASLGISIKFTENACMLKYPTTEILFGTLHKNLYILKMSISNKNGSGYNNALSCIHEWHRKMGHKNIAHIKKIKDKLNLKIDKCDCSNDCEGCLKGKFHALPYPQISEKPMFPRDVVTTDVCGHFRTESIGGSRYFVTFTCANTDYTEVAAIKSKADCKIELIRYLNRCHNQFGRFPKVIRSDRGGEYLDKELQSFLDDNGIIFQCTVPRCPQQNGISERKNRTLLEAVRTMLMTKNLPNNFWAEALHHANNTFNNIPKEYNSPSPKEKFFDKEFSFPFIEFGAPLFFATNSFNRSKLDERGSPGIFLGIDHHSKGFRILADGKIRIERNVKLLSPITNKLCNKYKDNITCEDEHKSTPTKETKILRKLRRSERIRLKQAIANNITSTQVPFEPKTYKQAISCDEKDKWIMAMQREINSIEQNNTWTPAELPKGRTAIGCRWVFKIKQSEIDENTRYKARLVAQGYTQKFGVDYDEVFAPVTRSSTFRSLLAIASSRKLYVEQYDVKSAF